ncbi:MAG TPA: glycosyltransferase family 2 protein [Candidatus Saccharimonadales bacterium]|nr:glycosyltransferase family 2 protein [Candidatus Saccharimonadales bacterium]
MKTSSVQLSVIVPSYNEEKNTAPFYKQLTKELTRERGLTYELIYINDGSSDGTVEEIRKLAKKDPRVRLVSFSRHFGKETATTAGIHVARGKAIVMIDADGQHPPQLIHDFLKKWRGGAKVIIGVRKANQKEGLVKRYGSKIFYSLFNTTSGTSLTPGATDFRLIDQDVQKEFKRLTERNRITRGLIDWVGFDKDIIEFVANPRMHGKASYNVSMLIQLFTNSFISLSLAPLYLLSIIGSIFTFIAFLFGIFVIVEQLIMGDPMHLKVTGTGMLGILLVFLVGIVLSSQGIIALYISRIHTETQNRPLYIIDETKSILPK